MSTGAKVAAVIGLAVALVVLLLFGVLFFLLMASLAFSVSPPPSERRSPGLAGRRRT